MQIKNILFFFTLATAGLARNLEFKIGQVDDCASPQIDEISNLKGTQGSNTVFVSPKLLVAANGADSKPFTSQFISTSLAAAVLSDSLKNRPQPGNLGLEKFYQSIVGSTDSALKALNKKVQNGFKQAMNRFSSEAEGKYGLERVSSATSLAVARLLDHPRSPKLQVLVNRSSRVAIFTKTPSADGRGFFLKLAHLSPDMKRGSRYNFPFPFASGAITWPDRATDRTVELDLGEGDLVIVGTNGLFGNLPASVITFLVNHLAAKMMVPGYSPNIPETELTQISEKLAWRLEKDWESIQKAAVDIAEKFRHKATEPLQNQPEKMEVNPGQEGKPKHQEHEPQGQPAENWTPSLVQPINSHLVPQPLEERPKLDSFSADFARDFDDDAEAFWGVQGIKTEKNQEDEWDFLMRPVPEDPEDFWGPFGFTPEHLWEDEHEFTLLQRKSVSSHPEVPHQTETEVAANNPKLSESPFNSLVPDASEIYDFESRRQPRKLMRENPKGRSQTGQTISEKSEKGEKRPARFTDLDFSRPIRLGSWDSPEEEFPEESQPQKFQKTATGRKGPSNLVDQSSTNPLIEKFFELPGVDLLNLRPEAWKSSSRTDLGFLDSVSTSAGEFLSQQFSFSEDDLRTFQKHFTGHHFSLGLARVAEEISRVEGYFPSIDYFSRLFGAYDFSNPNAKLAEVAVGVGLVVDTDRLPSTFDREEELRFLKEKLESLFGQLDSAIFDFMRDLIYREKESELYRKNKPLNLQTQRGEGPASRRPANVDPLAGRSNQQISQAKSNKIKI